MKGGSMPDYPGTNPKLDDQLREAAQKIEAEVQRAVRYLNDEVVPQVRVHSSRGLRQAAEQLRKLADNLDQHGRG
jgi:ribosomal protein S15P/S13E